MAVGFDDDFVDLVEVVREDLEREVARTPEGQEHERLAETLRQIELITEWIERGPRQLMEVIAEHEVRHARTLH